MTVMRESELQKKVLDFLKNEIGAEVWTNTAAGFYSELGIPDITGVLPGGKAIFIETKRTKGSTYRPEQLNKLFMANHLGAFSMCVYAENFEEFRERVLAETPREWDGDQVAVLMGSLLGLKIPKTALRLQELLDGKYTDAHIVPKRV